MKIKFPFDIVQSGDNEIETVSTHGVTLFHIELSHEIEKHLSPEQINKIHHATFKAIILETMVITA